MPASPVARRWFLQECGVGLGAAGLASLLADDARAAVADPLAPKVPPLPAKAKRVIFLFMQGGVSHLDSFDPKPRLAADDGKQASFNDARKAANTGSGESSQRIMKSPWTFSQHGQSGLWASTLFPEIAKCVDDLCFVRSMHTEGVAHGPATLFLHCGATSFGRPGLGAWALYGLGSESRDLPGFVSIAPSTRSNGGRAAATPVGAAPFCRHGLPAAPRSARRGRAGRGPRQPRRAGRRRGPAAGRRRWTP
jgi:hypothetical protein